MADMGSPVLIEDHPLTVDHELNGHQGVSDPLCRGLVKIRW
jgi:hypothetical protein